MLSPEQSQIFFYLSISICVIILTLIFVIKQIQMTLILKTISNIVKEVEDKVYFLKNLIELIKEKLSDTKFFLDKIDKIFDYVMRAKNNFTDGEKEEEIIHKKRKTKKQKTKK